MKQSALKQYAVVTGLVAVLALISFLLFYYGRQHRVVIDNRAAETADGRSVRALPGARVAVNQAGRGALEEAGAPAARPMLTFRFWPLPDQSAAGAAVEMLPRERIMVKVLGPSFNLKAEVLDQFGEAEKTIDVNIKLGTRRDAMVRLVKLARDIPEPLEDFPDDSFRPAEGDAEVPAPGDMQPQ